MRPVPPIRGCPACANFDDGTAVLETGASGCRECGAISGDAGERLPEADPDPDGFAAELVERHELTPGDLVVEIGSGDGSRLAAVREWGPQVLGVEPDVRAMARAFHAGVDTVAAFFGPSTAGYIRQRYGLARVLLIRHVRGVSNLPALIAAAAACLTPGGVVVVEVSCGGTRRLVEFSPRPATVLQTA